MVQHEIIGDDMQAVIITMGAGDTIRAEAGAMMYMTDGVEMDTKMDGGFLGGHHGRCRRATGTPGLPARLRPSGGRTEHSGADAEIP